MNEGNNKNKGKNNWQKKLNESIDFQQNQKLTLWIIIQ